MKTEKQEEQHSGPLPPDEQQETQADEKERETNQVESAPTRVGQVLQEWGHRLTEQMAAARQGRHKAPPPSQERIGEIIQAMGDPEHPNHQAAVDELVAIGAPAVSQLNECLDPQKPWLRAYRAAEALSRIQDGRASGALIQALRHPNSNVRWGAVRALAQVGDLRALFELRRVAHEDHGRTSWGESVAGAAQSALDQIQTQSVWHQSIELIKTAFTSVLMILSLILAFSVINTLQNEIERMGQTTPIRIAPTTYVVPTTSAWGSNGNGEGNTNGNASAAETEPGEGDIPEIESTPTPSPTPEPTEVPEEIIGRVLSGANVRPGPSVRNNPIGAVNQGDEIIFLSVSPDGMWYRVRLGSRYADSSHIDNDNDNDNDNGSNTGWIHRELVSQPRDDVPVEDPLEATPAIPEATTTPSPTEVP
jgi:hypothetical protein